MQEVYLTAVPLQPLGPKVLYETKNYENPANIETCFPIIPILNRNAGTPEGKTVIAVRTKNDDTDRNMDKLREEVRLIGVSGNSIEIRDIAVPEDQMEIVNGSFLMNVLDTIEDDSLIFADITYGTKLTSVMLVYALLAIDRIKDTEVKGIYYGEVVRENNIPKAYFSYDMTRLMVMSGSIESLDRLGITDKRRMIERLFGL